MEEREQFPSSSPQRIHLLPRSLPPALSCLHLIPLGWSACSLFQPQPLLLSSQFVNSFCGPSHATLFSSSCVGSLVGFWISILMKMHDKVSWILNLDTLLFPGFSLLRAPSSAIPFSFQPFPPTTHMDVSKTSIFLPRDICASTYSYMTFHSLTSVAEIPWVRKPEMFPWLLRLILARHREKGVRDHAEFLPDPRSPLRAMPWEGDLPTGPGALPLGWQHWRLKSTLLFLQSSGRILGRWKLSFKLKEWIELHSVIYGLGQGFQNCIKSYSWPSSLLVICVKWKHRFVRNILPHLLPNCVFNQVLEIELGVGKGT